MTPYIQLESEHTLQRCKKCAHITSTPIPSPAELKEYYDGFLYGVPDADEFENKEKESERNAKFILRNIKSHLNDETSGRLLDWGGGSGMMTRAFYKHGLKAEFADIDPQVCEFAEGHLPSEITIHNCPPEEVAGIDNWDFIYCSHVIEHLPDPEKTAKAMYSGLKEGGIAMICTPNQSSWEGLIPKIAPNANFGWRWMSNYISKGKGSWIRNFFRFIRRPWFCVDPPRHIHAFNRKSLRKMFENNGFEVIRVFTEMKSSQYHSLGAWRPYIKYHRPLSLVKMVFESMTWVAWKILQVLDIRKRHGTNLVLYARKQSQ